MHGCNACVRISVWTAAPQVCVCVCVSSLFAFCVHVVTPSPFVNHQHVCVASAVAQGLTERIQGTSAFLFGWADAPLQRGLAQRRKEMGWFKKSPDLQATRSDVGPQPQKRFGLTGEPQVYDNLTVF